MSLLTGKEFEEICLFRAKAEEECKTLTMSRYGVQASFREGDWLPVPSYPDFEGVTAGGRQFIFDAKVCSGPSFKLDHGSSLFRLQMRHLLRRSAFSVTTFLLVHFNRRVLKTKEEPEITVALPVTKDGSIWEEYDRGERHAVTRTDAVRYGIVVPWNLYSERAKTPSPDLLYAVKALRGVIDESART